MYLQMVMKIDVQTKAMISDVDFQGQEIPFTLHSQQNIWFCARQR